MSRAIYQDPKFGPVDFGDGCNDTRSDRDRYINADDKDRAEIRMGLAVKAAVAIAVTPDDDAADIFKRWCGAWDAALGREKS